ncbi:MAG: dipeptidase [Proteobacteria bacterium]|nr:dipeptidase [Pseudomonadota bacterium]
MPPSRSALLTRARDFLDRVALIDAHNDLPYVIRHANAAGDVAAYDLNRVHQETDTDIPRLRQGRLAGQFWAAFVPTDVADPVKFTLEQIALIKRVNAAHPDVFLPALRAGDVARAKRAGKIASFISVESGVGLGNSLELLPLWHELGVRYLTLCHNETLDWVDSATDAPRHNGLSDFGRAVITECNRLGIMVDLSHTSHDAQMQALDVTRAPVAITHTNAFSLVDHPRNVKDEVLIRLKANGGIVCATFVQTFTNQATRDWVKAISDPWGKPLAGNMKAGIAAHEAAAGPCPPATLAQVCDHIDYMATKAGIDHIGIGSDYYGSRNPMGLEDVSCFPNLIAELMGRGWSEANLRKVASGNMLRVLRGVAKAAE